MAYCAEFKPGNGNAKEESWLEDSPYNVEGSVEISSCPGLRQPEGEMPVGDGMAPEEPEIVRLRQPFSRFFSFHGMLNSMFCSSCDVTSASRRPFWAELAEEE